MTPPCVDLPRQLARANASDLKAGTDGEGDVNGTDGDGRVDEFPDGNGAAHWLREGAEAKLIHLLMNLLMVEGADDEER